VLYGEETVTYKKRNEETTWEFLEAGFELIEERLNLLEQAERTGRGGVQTLDWEDVETDVGVLESGAGEQNGGTLCPAIQSTVGKILDASKITQKYFYAPPILCLLFFRLLFTPFAVK
jgi:hypothetical protein